MKTQNRGLRPLWRTYRRIWPSQFFLACAGAVKNYKENRENGTSQDGPTPLFPSENFENLEIKGWNTQSGKWPDSQERFWYELTLKDGTKNTDFYYKQTNSFKDAKGNTCWEFVIGHRRGVEITGFIQKPNYDEGFPRSGGCYYYDFEFSDERNPAIRQWMEEKDLNYLRRIRQENPSLYKAEIADLKSKNPQHPALARLLKEDNKLREDKIEAIKRITSNLTAESVTLGIKGILCLTDKLSQDDTQARIYLKQAFAQRNPLATCYLGMLYDYGLGVRSSVTAALFFYTKADSRFPLLQVLLAVHYIRDTKQANYGAAEQAADLLLSASNPQAAYADYEYHEVFDLVKGCAQQHVGAMLLMAVVYTRGLLGVNKDEHEANRWLEKIAEHGDAWTQYNLGVMFEKGFWFAQSHKTAAKWYELAANKRLTSAQRSLSLLYRLGYLEDEGSRLADKWSQLAEKPESKLPASPPITETLPSPGLVQRIGRLFSSSGELSLQLLTENVLTAKALYDWPSDRDDRLSIQQNEQLYVLQQTGDWWWCENQHHQEGLVPRTFLELLPIPTTPLPANEAVGGVAQISQSELVFIRELGRGAFGVVSEETYFDMSVAVKKTKSLYNSDDDRIAFEKELDVMKKVHHPNVVKLWAYTTDTPVPQLVMEFMDGGTLFSQLGGRPKEKCDSLLPWIVRFRIAINIVNGLMYLHRTRVIHRDLKSENVLLCHQPNNPYFAKITDFGLSKRLTDDKGSLKTLRSDAAMGTMTHMAPELLAKQGKVGVYRYNAKTDIYALAMVLWELITHSIPYTDGKFYDSVTKKA